MKPIQLLKLVSQAFTMASSQEELCQVADDILDILETIAKHADKDPDTQNAAEKVLAFARQVQVAVCGPMPD